MELIANMSVVIAVDPGIRRRIDFQDNDGFGVQGLVVVIGDLAGEKGEQEEYKEWFHDTPFDNVR